MFKKGQIVSIPRYGIATVRGVSTKKVGDKTKDFYYFEEENVHQLIPCDEASKRGIRPLISKEKAVRVIQCLLTEVIDVDRTSWNRRYREYSEKVDTGNVDDLAYVVVAIRSLKLTKDISFGERKMFDRAKTLLERELAFVLGVEEYLSLLNDLPKVIF